MSQDPHQGGDLLDMAATGSHHAQRCWKDEHHPLSVSLATEKASISRLESRMRMRARGTLAGAAGEGADIPRTDKNIGATGEVEMGTESREVAV
jgi:hypothetical protein